MRFAWHRRIVIPISSHGGCWRHGDLSQTFQRHSQFWQHAARAISSSCSPNKSGLLEHYNCLVEQGVLQHDAQQQKVAVALEELLQQMKHYQKDMELYHAKLSDWETRRQQLRQQMLREEAKKAAQRQLQKKTYEQEKGFIMRWFSSWSKQLQQHMLREEAEKEAQLQLQKFGDEQREGSIMRWISRKKRKHKEVEPGAGRMVARIKREKNLDLLVGPRPAMPSGPKGVYIYGSVGCGKTMLMDMLFNAADGVVKYRRRLHFHAAMLEVHDRMHKLWKKQLEKKEKAGLETSNCTSGVSDKTDSLSLEKAIKNWLDAEEKFEQEWNSGTTLLDLVAEDLLGNIEGTGGGASVLCFDEMQVVDVFTAVALAGILGRLIRKGTIIVATSNREPNDLNKDGMQKEIFDKFIAELQCHCHLILVGTEKDYRRALASGGLEKSGWKNYFWPLDSHSEMILEEKWKNFVKQAGGKVVSVTVPVMFGRVLDVPESCNGVARFSFEQLCDRPVGAADYIALAQNFHTVFVTGIPMMSMRNRDKARRFITLIDELYNHRRQMLCTAATSIDELFLGSDEGSLIDLESLQFETEAESSRLRRNVLSPGSVAPLAATKEQRTSIQSLLSGREELFAFQRAVSRLIEMQTPVYLEALNLHIN